MAGQDGRQDEKKTAEGVVGVTRGVRAVQRRRLEQGASMTFRVCNEKVTFNYLRRSWNPVAFLILTQILIWTPGLLLTRALLDPPEVEEALPRGL